MIVTYEAPSKGSPMEAPTLLRDLHWTPLDGPGMKHIMPALTPDPTPMQVNMPYTECLGIAQNPTTHQPVRISFFTNLT